jgi:hypothetical protein
MSEQVKGLGSGGWCYDTPSVTLPMNVFSDVLNVRFDDDSVQSITGETTHRNLPITADYGVHWRRPDQGYNIFGHDGVFYRVDAAGSQSLMLNSVAAQYAGSNWQDTYFNGGYAIVINNGKSTPLYCLYNDPVAGSSFQELPNWNYISGLTVYAAVVRSLNYSLVAANLTLTQGGTTTYAPGTIRVSVQAATGAIPTVWLPGLTTDTADEFELSSTSPVLDMMELRGNMFVYSQDSISVLTIGQTTRVSPYSKTYGILGTDCVCEFDGNHFVVDRNDIYVHNGSGAINSIADFRIKKYFFSNLNQSHIDKVNVIRDIRHKEIWICYPKGTATSCTEALIFQYKNNTWTKRALGNITYTFTGPANTSNSWQYGIDAVYLCTTGTQTLMTNDSYLMWNGSTLASYTSYAEKLKMNTGDVSGSSYINAIYPVFDRVPSGSTITIRVSGQNGYVDNADLSVDGSNRTTFLFDDSAQNSKRYKVDPRANGRLFNYRISAQGEWRLATLSVDAQQADRR